LKICHLATLDGNGQKVWCCTGWPDSCGKKLPKLEPKHYYVKFKIITFLLQKLKSFGQIL
jgi:hypothetical protein